MKCTNHVDVDAIGMCTYCGKPFCKDCLVEVKERMYCKNDLGNVLDEAKSSGGTGGSPIINVNQNQANTQTQTGGGFVPPPKSKITALLLCIFFGWLGVHRFYVGKSGTGVLWLLTVGLGGIGVIVDLIMILSGGFKDYWGQPLV